MVSGAECDSGEIAHVVERKRPPPRQANLQRFATRPVDAAQTGGNRRGIICNQQVAGT
jgi:hypothetical protein